MDSLLTSISTNDISVHTFEAPIPIRTDTLIALFGLGSSLLASVSDCRTVRRPTYYEMMQFQYLGCCFRSSSVLNQHIYVFPLGRHSGHLFTSILTFHLKLFIGWVYMRVSSLNAWEYVSVCVCAMKCQLQAL